MSAIRKNIVWLLISQMATWVITAITVVLVPTLLGDEDLGTLVFANAYVGFFTIIASLGTSTLMTREVARDHAVLSPYVYNAAVFKVLLVSGLSAVGLVLAVALGTRGAALVMIAVNFIGMMIIVIGEILHSALAGLERMAKPAMWGVVQAYVANAIGLLVLLLGGGLVAFGTIMVLGNAIPTVAMAIMVWPLVRHHGRLDFAVWKWFVRAGIPLTALAFSNLVYGTVDIPILSFQTNDATVGWYNVAQRWIGIPVFISTAVMAAFYPSFSSLAKRGGPPFATQVNKAVILVLLAAVPSAVGLGVVADDLIPLLYRPEYDNSIVLMQILAVHLPLTAVDTILAMALIAADRQRRYVFVAFGAAVLNPIACLIVIPMTAEAYGNGAIGAAIVTVATELLIMCGALALRSKGVLDRRATLKCVRIVAAGLTMGAVVWAADDLPLAVQVAIGVVVYGVASIALRTVSLDDLRDVMPARMSHALAKRSRGEDGIIEDGGGEHDDGSDTHVSGDLYAQPRGQDRDSSLERPGE